MVTHCKYVLICQGCQHTREVGQDEVTAGLTALLCSVCGDERQPFLRAVQGDSVDAHPHSIANLMRGMMARWHVPL